MKEKFKLMEVWFKIVLLFVFSALYIMAIPYPEKSRQFPQLLAVITILMTVASLIVDFSRKETVMGEITDVDDTEVKVLDEETKRARKKRFKQAWAIILVSTGIGFLGGFLFSTFLYFIGFALIFGSRQKLVKNLVIAVLMTIFIYIIFQEVMSVPLLEGLLW